MKKTTTAIHLTDKQLVMIASAIEYMMQHDDELRSDEPRSQEYDDIMELLTNG